MQDALNRLFKWADTWPLGISYKKCYGLPISSPSLDHVFAFCSNTIATVDVALLFNNGLNVGLEEVDLVHVFRLGRRADVGICRPLLVELASYTFKNITMESLYKLRHVDRKFRGVTISHDMTKLEREECRQLVEEVKSMATEDDSGEYLYRVRGPPGQMKIIKIRLTSSR